MSINLQNRDIASIASKLCGEDIIDIIPSGFGANSHIFQISSSSASYCLKFYRSTGVGQLSRRETEALALRFFEKNNIYNVPRILETSEKYNCSLLEWIEGDRISDYTEDNFKILANFLKDLHHLRDRTEAGQFPLGTEACLSLHEMIRQLHGRLERLQKGMMDPHYKKFLDTQVAPLIGIITDWAKDQYRENGWNVEQEINRVNQTLSPVDFGFHNTIKNKEGKVIFIDFEYFGWADPVNIISDTLWHPGMMLSKSEKKRLFILLFNIYNESNFLLERLRIFYPLYGLRWCFIMLNRFLPGYTLAGNEGLTKEEKIRLDEEAFMKVQMFLKMIQNSYKEFPYEKD